MKLTLQKTGQYEVIEENDGACAWKTARRVRPDLILMDIVMPNVDGGDAAAQIQKDPELTGIPIVFLTAIVSPPYKMSDPIETEVPLFGARAAAFLGGVFLAAFVLCAVLVGSDRAHRTRLEVVLPQSPAAQPGR